MSLPDAWFLARDGERIVGASTLQRLAGSHATVETGYTGVHPEYRRRGVAKALKLRTIAYAAAYGIGTVRTDSNATNRPMIAINTALAFEPPPARISFELRLGSDRSDANPHPG